MTLEELKAKTLQEQSMWLSEMRGVIAMKPTEQLEALRIRGYQSGGLVEFLTKSIIHVTKETEKLARQYEKDNPL